MAITIKEIRVITTVTRDQQQDRPVTDEALGELKREILEELKRTMDRNRRKNRDDER